MLPGKTLVWVCVLALGMGLVIPGDQPDVSAPPVLAGGPLRVGVIVLAPADRFVRQLALVDPGTGDTIPLTDSEYGIEDFAVDSGGRRIAYTRSDSDGTADIWLLDLDSQQTRPVTNCVNAICHAPAWNPDGSLIAYQRDDYNAGPGTGLGPGRTWIVDLENLHTELLFLDAHSLGEQPVWSPDGRRIAVFDPGAQAVRVIDLVTGRDDLFTGAQGLTGHFSPDGSKLVIAVLVRGLLGPEFYTHLEMIDFQTGERTRISGAEDAPVDDVGGVWSPDGSKLLIARRYLDERYTPGRQIVLLDMTAGETESLVVDAAYTHSALSWDAAGTRIVYQRTALDSPEALPEVWTLDLVTGEQTLVVENALLPAWVS
ncbi:MAG: PD40 domain-containing protein [Anaerolineae bacterium]|nr:PD40 domain-containing protein [Anaerolineae bacterium]